LVSFFEILFSLSLFLISYLGTPDDLTWPGFSSMPDHKKTFPQWKSQNMAELLSNLSSDALQLTLQMLIYDPDRRITAKSALESTYFQSMSPHLIIPLQINPTKNVAGNSNSSSSNNQSDIQ
jgi:serine/threonine protein kinase